jgi:hypothetical protein
MPASPASGARQQSTERKSVRNISSILSVPQNAEARMAPFDPVLNHQPRRTEELLAKLQTQGAGVTVTRASWACPSTESLML